MPANTTLPTIQQPLQRRTFLGLAGAGATALLLASCSKDSTDTTDTRPEVGFISGDANKEKALVQYTYFLESFLLFYLNKAQQALPLSDPAQPILKELVAYRTIYLDFYKSLLGTTLPGPLGFTTANINMGNQAEVLEFAVVFIDQVTAAYNGMAFRSKLAERITFFGKVASASARQATEMRKAQQPTDWSWRAASDATVMSSGLGAVLSPAELVRQLNVYLTSSINTGNLP